MKLWEWLKNRFRQDVEEISYWVDRVEEIDNEGAWDDEF